MDAPSREVLRRLTADLIHINRQTLGTEASLALRWSASPDGRRYTLQLRPGLRFSDGHSCDADDVVFSFSVYLDEAVHSPQRDVLMVGGRPITVRKIDSLTVAHDVRYFPRTNCKTRRLHTLGKRSTNSLGNQRVTRVFVWRSIGIRARVLRVFAVEFDELRVPSHVVEMGVRVDRDYRQLRQALDDLSDFAHAQPRIEQQRSLLTDDQVRDHFLKLMRLVNREHPRTNPVDLEPRIGRRDSFERLIFRARPSRCMDGRAAS